MSDKVTTLPEWAPDDCPPAVVQLVKDEQYLEDMKLRELASSDSAELHQAVRRLQQHISAAFAAGQAARSGRQDLRYAAAWLAIGYGVGALCGVLVAFWAFT